MSRTVAKGAGRLAVCAALLAGSSAHASFLSGELLDTAADWLAIIVLCVVPIGVIVLFWLVHILPEKIAEKRHHPQKEAITTLCLLSLVFGGMLWPVAWLWAYTRPIGYKVAYGTDKHDDYFAEMEHKARSGTLLPEESKHLQDELDEMEARGKLPPKLKDLKSGLDRLRAEALASQAAAGERRGGGA
jgi:CBS domain containing-hemolysin-like protein